MITIYTNKVAAGDRIRFTPVIRINPRYKSDRGLHAHEQTHVLQWLVVGLIAAIPVFLLTNWFIALCVAIITHDALYHVIPAYRLQSELQAYRRQLKRGGSAELAAKAISADYGLKITYEEALRKLT